MEMKKVATVELGVYTVSAVGLRRMANAVEQRYGADVDVRLKHGIAVYEDGTQTLQIDL